MMSWNDWSAPSSEEGNWQPLLNQVLDKITIRFGKRDYILDEETKQEEKLLKDAAIKCLTESMSLMLEKLNVTDRQDILEQLYCQIYKSEQFKYFNEFRTNALNLFLQIKQCQ
jgi:hypothetical protein